MPIPIGIQSKAMGVDLFYAPLSPACLDLLHSPTATGRAAIPLLLSCNPKYRIHRASGQAIVTLDCNDGYLGRYSFESMCCWLPVSTSMSARRVRTPQIHNFTSRILLSQVS
jgi:hypothetical protein